MNDVSVKTGIWFVYDGDCPLCESAALALRIKKEYGTLILLNAREEKDHELLKEISDRGFDLDEGMVIYNGDRYFHGKDALKFMARYGEKKGLFNLFNKSLFWSDAIATLLYPWMRGVRNLLLRRKNVSRIDNLNLSLEPTFKSVFGKSWDDLPPVLHQHYMNRPYTDDINTVEGMLDVSCSGPIKTLSPLFWLMGGIPPYNEKNVPVTVRFESNKNTKEFRFNRIFHLNTRAPYSFQSSMIQTTGNEVIEMMSFGIGWRTSFHWEDSKVKLKHKGYVIKLFGHLMPVPLTLLMGQGNAEETAVDDSTFDMQVQITHPWWGTIYEYKGRFQIKDNR